MTLQAAVDSLDTPEAVDAACAPYLKQARANQLAGYLTFGAYYECLVALTLSAMCKRPIVVGVTHAYPVGLLAAETMVPLTAALCDKIAWFDSREDAETVDA